LYAAKTTIAGKGHKTELVQGEDKEVFS